MTRLHGFIVSLAAALLLAGCAAPDAGTGELYQSSTFAALLEGQYDGATTLGQLKLHGDTGIGTFDALDGEMILLDGIVYQARADGKVYRPADSLKTPFANAAFFCSPVTATLPADCLDLNSLVTTLDGAVATKQSPCLVRIHGTFDLIKVRSVPRQSPPYPCLADVVKTQSVFEFRNVTGTIIGLRCPDSMAALNVPGWHLHFLADDRARGGHLLDCRFARREIQLQPLGQLHVDFPPHDYRAISPERRAEETQTIEK